MKKHIYALALIAALIMTSCANSADSDSAPEVTAQSTTTTTSQTTEQTENIVEVEIDGEPITTTTEETTTTTTTTKATTTKKKTKATTTTTTKATTTTTQPPVTTTKAVTTTAKPVTTTAKPATTTAKPVTTTTTTKATTTTTAAAKSSKSKLDLAYEAIIKGNSTAAQRELIRQDLIKYVKDKYSIKLDESLYAWTDENGNRTDKEAEAVDWGNCSYDFGVSNEFYSTDYYLTDYNWFGQYYTLSQLADMLKKEMYTSIDNSRYNDGKKSFNIVLYEHLYSMTQYSPIKLNTGIDIPEYVMVMCIEP